MYLEFRYKLTQSNMNNTEKQNQEFTIWPNIPQVIGDFCLSWTEYSAEDCVPSLTHDGQLPPYIYKVQCMNKVQMREYIGTKYSSRQGVISIATCTVRSWELILQCKPQQFHRILFHSQCGCSRNVSREIIHSSHTSRNYLNWFNWYKLVIISTHRDISSHSLLILWRIGHCWLPFF